MHVGVAQAKNRFSDLLRSVEEGEIVVITRNGRPVAQLSPIAAVGRKVNIGWAKGAMELKPGWDAPIDPDEFLRGSI